MNYILLQKHSFCPDESNHLKGKSLLPKCLVEVRVKEFWGTHLEQELVLPFDVRLDINETGELWISKILVLLLLFKKKRVSKEYMRDYLFISRRKKFLFYFTMKIKILLSLSSVVSGHPLGFWWNVKRNFWSI